VLFATEVIAGRDILFFDRPTSDLDAQSALSVVTALQRVSRSGKLVVITAGSLTFREYAILDRIQLLSNKGESMGWGDGLCRCVCVCVYVNKSAFKGWGDA
jgi:ABC-type multidrug transport system ATPase subunit